MMMQRSERKVAFHPSIEVYLVPRGNRSTWLNQEDYENIRNGARRTVRAMLQHSGTNGEDSQIDDDLDESKHCYHGLDHRRSPAHCEQIKINRDCCFSAVFDAQQRQRVVGHCNEEAISKASRRGSQWARAQALQRGLSIAAPSVERRESKVRRIVSWNENSNTNCTNQAEELLQRARRLYQQETVIPGVETTQKKSLRRSSIVPVDLLTRKICNNGIADECTARMSLNSKVTHGKRLSLCRISIESPSPMPFKQKHVETSL
uniref:Uncharacterized protein n=1 Tax=Odontella aurita TaxID=265563 RepID=A0A7S4NB91_9STRA|mmetsp:Transcript_5602/g.16237  ORF Transcript_5602/g.16237 Transcript_5602/m.16237 type:complete len:262 (+) Transcript_5602:102-887(+)